MRLNVKLHISLLILTSLVQLKGRITAALKILKEAPELCNTISDDREDGLSKVLSESVMAINNRRLGSGL